MNEYTVRIELRVEAQNVGSASKKVLPVEKVCRRVGHVAHIELEGKKLDTSSDRM
jgi:hypothetical protein